MATVVRCGGGWTARLSPPWWRGSPAEAPGRLTQSWLARFVGRSPKVGLQQRFHVGALGDRRTQRGEFAVTTLRGEGRVNTRPTGHIDRFGGDHRSDRADLVAASADAGTTQHPRGALFGPVRRVAP